MVNMLLAIDTSTDMASLAISERGEVWAELTWRCGRNHSVELVPNLLRLLDLTKISLGRINGVVVASGPGSFNGLRVGMATAKGLAFSLGVPLVGISTLEMMAFSHASALLPVCSLLDARRGELAAALFQTKDDSWQRLLDDHITCVADLICRITKRTLFCGEAPAEAVFRLRERLGTKAVLSLGAARRAGYLADLGWRRLEAGDRDDPATLQPTYL
ncbi:tRNA (adenosine(37)-N6)-threonylcarbamoyltransferase complex dimerization subunit type 1 TsaB, partial [Chloroflexota bacterium]